MGFNKLVWNYFMGSKDSGFKNIKGSFLNETGNERNLMPAGLVENDGSNFKWFPRLSGDQSSKPVIPVSSGFSLRSGSKRTSTG